VFAIIHPGGVASGSHHHPPQWSGDAQSRPPSTGVMVMTAHRHSNGEDGVDYSSLVHWRG